MIKSITRKNAPLKHLDLSFNSISLKESKCISIELNKNHTLYGFHFEGNCQAYVDIRGHL